MAIPTVILEEHNEAFLAWNLAVHRGVIRGQGNLLIHVDEHADMDAPRFHRSVYDVLSAPESLVDFTNSEVAIYEFITPAILQGMFADVYWVRQGVKKRDEGKLVVFSERNEGRKLVVLPLPGPDDVGFESPPDGVDHREFRLIVQGTRPEIPTYDSTVLDIDLDFFSSDQAEHRVDRLEISREEFETFNRDKHHFLRMDFGARVTALEDAGRYYLHFRDFSSHYPCRSKVGWEAIEARIILFSRMLKRSSVQPKLITVARSRLSGYTPADQWEEIEKKLLECLRDHYELNLVTTEQLLDTSVPISN